jgi:autotransporter adhesin
LKIIALASAIALALTLSPVQAQVTGGTTPDTACDQDGSNMACGERSNVPAFDEQGNRANQTTAIGVGAKASGSQTLAVGNHAIANYAGTALGAIATAKGTNSDHSSTGADGYFGFGTAIGNDSHANGYASIAVAGYRAIANGYASTAIGLHAQTGTANAPGGNGDIAIGSRASTTVASGAQTSGNIAIGSSSGTVAGGQPSGFDTTVGITQATGGDAIAIGSGASAPGKAAVSIGASTSATGWYDVVLGNGSTTTGNYGGTAVGGSDPSQNKYNIAGQNGSAFGFASQAKGVGDTAIGSFADTGPANPNDPNDDSQNSYRTSVGYKSSSTGIGSVALGTFNSATGAGAVAIGFGSKASGDNSIALGAGSNDGGRANVVSVGSANATRTITNVTAGVADTDAVNVGQLNNAIGGVNTAITNVATSVATISDTVQDLATQVGDGPVNAEQALVAASAANVTANAANVTANAAMTQAQQSAVQIEALVNGQAGICTVSNGAMSCSIPNEKPASASGTGALAQGIGATATGEGNVAIGANASATGANSVALGAGSNASRDNTVDVGGRQITGVAAGTAPTDAVNVSQLNASSADTLNKANAYTDSVFNSSLRKANVYAARAAAQAMAVPSIPMLAPGQKWVGAAAGTYDGQSAIGVGFGYQINQNWNVGGGISTATSSSDGTGSHLAGKLQAGYTW